MALAVAEIPERGRSSTIPMPITPKCAWALLQADSSARLIDTRSTLEYVMVGHPVGAVHIPWMDEPDWVPDARFSARIKDVFSSHESVPVPGHAPPILLICRCGERSSDAGKCLIDDGMANVYNVEGGFEGPLDDNRQRSTSSGWRFDGLPWQQY